MTPTNEALIVIILLLVASLLVAYITVVVLQGTAIVTNERVKLGGGAAMFVVAFVLINHFMPEIRDGIRAEDAAASAQTIALSQDSSQQDPVPIALSPSSQVTTKLDLDRLSPNDYVYDPELEIAVGRPNGNTWLAGSLPDGVDTIDLSQIPLFQVALEAMRSLSGLDEEGVRTFGVRSADSYKLLINADSKIDGVRVDINPYTDEKYFTSYFRSMLQAGLTIMEDQAPSESKIDEMMENQRPVMDAMREMLSGGYQDLVDRTFPKEFVIRNGVYVTPISRDILAPPMEGISAQLSSNATLLDRALEHMSMTGMLGSITTNIQVAQRERVISYNGTVSLENVLLDDEQVDLSIHHIGFIVAGEQRAVAVNLIFFETGPDSISVLTTLQNYLRSLRFTT